MSGGQNRNSGCSASALALRNKSQSPSRDLSSGLSQSVGCEGLLSSERSGDSTVTSNELLDIPRDYLDQLTVLKHLAKEVQVRVQIILINKSFDKNQDSLRID